MQQHNQGYGICGAKNVYSTNVKLGNWVEDKIGRELANQPRRGMITSDTETRLHFTPLENRPEPPNMPVNMPSNQELKAKNKDGMSYSLLFDHGIKPVSTDDRFTTCTMEAMQKRTDLIENALDKKILQRLKAKEMRNDINLSNTKTTEMRFANGHLTVSNSASQTPNVQSIGKTAMVPSFHRTRPLTSTFPDPIPGL